MISKIAITDFMVRGAEKINMEPEEEVEWRKNEYAPRLKKVGKVRQALVMLEEHLQYVQDEIGSTAIVPSRYFAKESEATAWLTGSE